MAKNDKMFDYPQDLRQAQWALEAARAERSAFLATLPVWGTSEGQELTDEQRAQSSRLLAAESEAARVVWAHTFWAELAVQDRVEARTKLNHIGPPPSAA
ncbi:hypothetical protein [Streptomyces sp. CB01881]|uniref:hypothetical protein n=1 Tax=Streptomyces sp. CB01881 TaxID=2078691 RepID=UPI0011DF5732|nr:hypothetical protein [Streptomyces sp. CB01881]TYC73879.1 hypothetical protein EH183_17810 [Streptomyces sp. CB01881]